MLELLFLHPVDYLRSIQITVIFQVEIITQVMVEVPELLLEVEVGFTSKLPVP